ncbi:hypothetical protein [Photorhabdus sp. RW14-46]|nr:hypothetical protein [Photorhabdus sp. RW14-46]
MTGVSECSQQRGNLKDDGYRFKQHLLLGCRSTILFIFVLSRMLVHPV